ncbi:hypothetical protein [Halobacillus karajensis]|uniref:Uncharacterized protein n=1 Tax=Halobacillus karajensis TaxID=195088 RepID=A0A024P7Y9_9BACI|nr:hypothetical protein [Halobacillus karajensis]CDQ20279.1 hypothetical protein BN982_02602 [Halobacillus karajensis]CDQ25060.1 hypothetical protein BN983_03365 [Halobacillus karajensis]CDQ28579.1 hypothetical protein BN981_02887 [Halobacillus karajensis]
MQDILAIWLDDQENLGVIEKESDPFGSSFHPIKRDRKTGEILVINNLWYTTYTGARHYFRLNTNEFRVCGRMHKVDLNNTKLKQPS